MMFQEMVNRIGADVPGMPRMLKWLSQFIPLAAGPLPIVFFFGVLAGEEPIDHTQKDVLREGKSLHPIMERVMAIHVAEEARHISFAHEYLRKRVPRHAAGGSGSGCRCTCRSSCGCCARRSWCRRAAFWKEFDIPRSVKRKEMFFRAPESRQMLRDMFGDVRMLCHDTGLMNPAAKLMWRICRIDGSPSRYRSEPQRQHLPSAPCRSPHRLRPMSRASPRPSRLGCPTSSPSRVAATGPASTPARSTASIRHRTSRASPPPRCCYIDPAACVDCGACVSACPVGAIAPDSGLDSTQLPFIALNAAFYPERPPGEKVPPTSKLAPVHPRAGGSPRGGRPLTVAIVGSGPAAMYAADELLTQPGVRVNVFEKLPTPYGLVRAGVAPDHQSTKRVTRLFDRIARQRGFAFYLNVEVGEHLTHADLLAHHHAVLYAVGAPNDRRLDIDGMGLPGTAHRHRGGGLDQRPPRLRRRCPST